MTERGYAGNQRYLIVTTAALCVLGGIGRGPAASRASRAAGRPRDRQRRAGLAATGVVARSSWALVALSPVIARQGRQRAT